MKATVKRYTSDGATNGRYPIKLIVTHQMKIKRRTIAHASEKEWDDYYQLPTPRYPDFENLYAKIMAFRNIAMSQVFKEVEDLELAMTFFEDKKEKKRFSFYEFAMAEVDRMERLNRYGNASAYRCAADQLDQFRPKLLLDDLSGPILEDFKQYKREQGLKNTSVRTYLLELRAIYNRAVKMAVVEDKQPFKGIFNDVPTRIRRQRNEYLDSRGMQKLKNLSGLSAQQQVSVDLSLLQF
ncbi:phage integrase SAM-like domain-containing protein [Robertkochia solimangrovi]|uniref:phage integrase SAM-like domain-containing protein n=1 Tax=Robertkochia solimangrovi TaxID=2213046 RepID=UPI00117EFC95|nr:phage integrase SAM-like domain-containing protein [Robertkochia solimangrovi]TRZ41679.1 hypothetical protein DMZ48_16870 [Robertkochia solimangrovi]